MASLVRILAIAASAVIALSFLFFAIDQSSEGSETQVRALDGPDAPAVEKRDAIDAPNPGPAVERAREGKNSSARELVDDGNDILVSPFTGVVDSGSLWVQRAVPALLGLLLFGLGGLMLANWLPQGQREHTDWREARG